MFDNDRLHDLLSRWEQSLETGVPLSPEELCHDWPEGLEELKRTIAILTRLDPLLDLRTAPAAVAEPAPPKLAGYQALERLGLGGMGVVYKAWDPRLERHVAIKVIRRRGSERQQVRRFDREAKVLAKLRHEHIVPIYLEHLDNDPPYFVMEFVAGGSLEHQVAAYEGQPARTAALVEQVAAALQHAHDNGVLHRDLKPANILLDRDGKPRVSDFGIAKLLADDAPEPAAATRGDTKTVRAALTTPDERPGTRAYMAPEQLADDSGAVGPLADVWALGVVLYELLTGQRPYPSGPGHRGSAAPAPTPPPVDARLAAVVMKCLERDPARRFPSAVAVETALRNWRLDEPIAGIAEGLRPRAQRWLRRHRVTAVLAAMVPVLLAVAALSYSLRHTPETVAETPPSNEAMTEERYRTAVAPIQEKLQRNLEARLIDENTKELAHRWRFGTGRITYPQPEDNNGAVSVTLRVPSLLELLPSPQRDSFRLVAELRQTMSWTTKSDLGLYVMSSRYPTPDGFLNLCVRACFADLGNQAELYGGPGEPKASRFDLRLYMLGDSKTDAFRSERMGARSRQAGRLYIPSRPKAPPGDWRTLVVEVRANRIKAWLDDIAVTVDVGQEWPQWRNSLEASSPDLKKLPLALTARGGIGLYATTSTVSIRQLRIEPLNDHTP